MIELHLTLSPYFLEHLRAMIDAVSGSLKERPAIPLRLEDEDDLDMHQAWRESILDSLRADVNVVMNILKDLTPGNNVVELSEEQGEHMLRASSALRLRLRESCLKDVTARALETGEVDFQELSPEDQRVYAVYLFLANLQEQLVAEVDEDASDWE